MLARMPAGLLNPSRAKGLPAYTGGNRAVGATRSTRNSAMPVMGSPSMRVIRGEDGSARTMLRRNMEHADLLSPSDLRRLTELMQQVEGTAKNLSRGGLSYRDLRKMGHPYGKGRRAGLGRLRGSGRGVSNKAIANMHTGNYARAWQGELMRDKSGVTLSLSNDAPYAAAMAFGTRRMVAHGPQTTAVAKYLPAIDAEWRRLARIASGRNEALAQIQGGVFARFGRGVR